jgi:S-formylglutathione hydrolase FrmB
VTHRMWLGRGSHLLALVGLIFLPPPRVSHAAQFQVILPPDAAQAPITGRLYLFMTQNPRGEPRTGPNWFAPEPFFRLDVIEFKPGENRLIDDTAVSFPRKLSELDAGTYRVQALLDHDFYSPHPALGVGNLYSQVTEVEVTGEPGQEVLLTLDQTVMAEPFPESTYVKEVVITSKLLSDFHGREVVDRAAVVLPASYESQPERRYPVIYNIPGFGGSHRDALAYANGPPPPGEGETEFIRVMLSGQCKWGHHVYADSATNGPRGAALTQELIPHIDAQFRTVAAPTARFVAGHSSGGWSSLWLQVAYPDVFGGVWSTSPDPVDFRDYQQVNLYADPPQNMFTDAAGERRPLARRGETPVLWYDSFTRMDDCLGRGGQLRSFEAVFSPLGDDGLPRRMYDRETGVVDPAVAKAWEAYDIRLKLERNWAELAPKLAGKLHVTMGDRDTFYLEGAVRQLRETLQQLGSDADVRLVEGADHGSLLTPDLFSEMRRQMTASYRAHHPE